MHKTVSFTQNATNVFFHILTQCNLKCRHCYINPEQHGRNTLDIDTIKNWLKPFSQQAARANVIFLGGEPTLHPELAAAVKHARRLGYGSVTIDTNGYLFHDILDKVTPDEVDFFSFSLDGATAATNDALRGTGSYAKCIEGIGRARQKGFGTSLIYTVSQANLHELDAMGPLLAQLGIERFFIQVLGLRGHSIRTGAGATPLKLVTRGNWQAVIPKAAENIARRGIRVTYPPVYLAPRMPFECAGLVAHNYFIFPNGRVYRCPLCEDYPIHAMRFDGQALHATPPINEADLFRLSIAEGCVMNKLIHPENLDYDSDNRPVGRIACCMLKTEIEPPKID